MPHWMRNNDIIKRWNLKYQIDVQWNIKDVSLFQHQQFYKLSQKWYGKTRVTSYVSRVASYELRVKSLKAAVENQKCQFQIHKLRVQVHKLRV